MLPCRVDLSNHAQLGSHRFNTQKSPDLASPAVVVDEWSVITKFLGQRLVRTDNLNYALACHIIIMWAAHIAMPWHRRKACRSAQVGKRGDGCELDEIEFPFPFHPRRPGNGLPVGPLEGVKPDISKTPLHGCHRGCYRCHGHVTRHLSCRAMLIPVDDALQTSIKHFARHWFLCK